MKNFIAILLSTIVSTLSFSQVYVGDITLEDQTAVNNFNTNYPGITYIEGSLIIGTNVYEQNIINDLSNLSSITGAENLQIFNCTNFNNWVPTQIQNLTLRFADINTNDVDYSGLPSFTSGLISLDTLVSLIYNSESTGAGNIPFGIFENLVSVGYLEIASSLDINIDNLNEVNELIYDISGGGRILLPALSILNALTCNGNPNPQDYFTPILPACSHIDNIAIHDPFCIDGLQGLSSLTSVGSLYILNAYSIIGLSNLVTADVIDIQVKQLNGLYSLQHAGKLDIMFSVDWNQSPIQNLIALNSLQSVDSLMISGEIAGIEGVNNVLINEYLHLDGLGISYCNYPSICNFIANHDPEDYFFGPNNGMGCSSAEEIEALCDPSVSSVFGEIFFDSNCNGTLDPNEFNVSPSYVQLDSSGEIFYNTDQFLAVTTPSTETSFSIVNLPDYYQASAPFTVTTAASGALNPFLAIPVCAAYDFNDIQTSFLSAINIVPGFTSVWRVQFTNLGSTTIDFIPTLTINTPEFVDEAFSQQGSYDGNTITWPATSISPGQVIELHCFITLLPTATILGEMFSCTANATIANGTDENPSDNTALFEQEITGAYDPNDKVVNTPQFNIETIDPAQPLDLTYRVRFQNTGTAPAVNVRVEDLLEEDLDPSTFQLLSSSHPVYYQIQGNQINFFFDNIMLPDSTSDPEGSIGTFFFRIKSNGNHTLESSIDNQVSIFFDFNEPIITNVASTIFYECTEVNLILENNTLFATEGFESYQWFFNGNVLEEVTGNTIPFPALGIYSVIATGVFECVDQSDEVEVISNINESSNTAFLVWPNPAKDILNIQTNYHGIVHLFDMQGKHVMRLTLNGETSIDLSLLPSGLYQMTSDTGPLGQFVKE